MKSKSSIQLYRPADLTLRPISSFTKSRLRDANNAVTSSELYPHAKDDLNQKRPANPNKAVCQVSEVHLVCMEVQSLLH
jgi:hypothetical protein